MRYLTVVFALVVMANSVGAFAQEQPKPKSKLGIGLLINYTPGAKKIIQANCAAITLFESGPEMMAAARDYKIIHPNGIVVVRYWYPPQYTITMDPIQCAHEYWEKGVWPKLSKLSDAQKKLIDYVESPNECEMLCWKNVEESAWNGKYLEAFIKIADEHHFKSCIANIPVGNPPGQTIEDTQQRILALVPALRLAKKTGGCWAYHAYTLKYTKDTKTEYYYSLRYRMFYDAFKKSAPDLMDMPMILGEGGVDNDGTNNAAPGWKRDTPERYKDWLKWFDSELQKDTYIKACTLFEIGYPKDWETFDLEPISDWLAAYLGE